MLLLLLLLLLLVLLLLLLVSDEEREREREFCPRVYRVDTWSGRSGRVGLLNDLVKSHRFFMHRMNMREKGRERISSMNDGCTTSWGGNLLFFWRFKKSRIVPLFFGERERLKERELCMYLKRLFFASALLGGIDLRFYEAAAAAGSGGQHLIFVFFGERGGKREKARERESEAIRCIYPPCRLWL